MTEEVAARESAERRALKHSSREDFQGTAAALADAEARCRALEQRLQAQQQQPAKPGDNQSSNSAPPAMAGPGNQLIA